MVTVSKVTSRLVAIAWCITAVVGVQLSLEVINGDDDGDENQATGGLDTRGGGVDIGFQGSEPQGGKDRLGAYSFQQGGLPGGVTVRSAFLQVECAVPRNTLGIVLLAHGDTDIDSLPIFGRRISERPLTNSFGILQFPLNVVEGNRFLFDVTSVIQELSNLPGWSVNSAITIRLGKAIGDESDAGISLKSIDFNPPGATLLTITFDEFSSQPTTSPPTPLIGGPDQNGVAEGPAAGSSTGEVAVFVGLGAIIGTLVVAVVVYGVSKRRERENERANPGIPRSVLSVISAGSSVNRESLEGLQYPYMTNPRYPSERPTFPTEKTKK